MPERMMRKDDSTIYQLELKTALSILARRYQDALAMIEQLIIERNQAQLDADITRNTQHIALKKTIARLTGENALLTQQLDSAAMTGQHGVDQEILRLNTIIARLTAENTTLKTNLKQTSQNLTTKREGEYSHLQEVVEKITQERNGLRTAVRCLEDTIAQRTAFFSKAPGSTQSGWNSFSPRLPSF